MLQKWGKAINVNVQCMHNSNTWKHARSWNSFTFLSCCIRSFSFYVCAYVHHKTSKERSCMIWRDCKRIELIKVLDMLKYIFNNGGRVQTHLRIVRVKKRITLFTYKKWKQAPLLKFINHIAPHGDLLFHGLMCSNILGGLKNIYFLLYYGWCIWYWKHFTKTDFPDGVHDATFGRNSCI